MIRHSCIAMDIRDIFFNFGNSIRILGITLFILNCKAYDNVEVTKCNHKCDRKYDLCYIALTSFRQSKGNELITDSITCFFSTSLPCFKKCDEKYPSNTSE
jgi:hypothetical protein